MKTKSKPPVFLIILTVIACIALTIAIINSAEIYPLILSMVGVALLTFATVCEWVKPKWYK